MMKPLFFYLLILLGGFPFIARFDGITIAIEGMGYQTEAKISEMEMDTLGLMAGINESQAPGRILIVEDNLFEELRVYYRLKMSQAVVAEADTQCLYKYFFTTEWQQLAPVFKDKYEVPSYQGNPTERLPFLTSEKLYKALRNRYGKWYDLASEPDEKKELIYLTDEVEVAFVGKYQGKVQARKIIFL